jgi:hypothetical protein
MYRSQQRKTKILFGLADILLTSAAFEIAYAVRTWLHFANEFYLLPDVKNLLLGFCAATWVAAGYWLNVYGKLEAARIRVILRDSARQVAYSALAITVFIVGLQQKSAAPFSPSLSSSQGQYDSATIAALSRVGPHGPADWDEVPDNSAPSESRIEMTGQSHLVHVAPIPVAVSLQL